jgi:hypothetical protein
MELTLGGQVDIDKKEHVCVHPGMFTVPLYQKKKIKKKMDTSALHGPTVLDFDYSFLGTTYTD